MPELERFGFQICYTIPALHFVSFLCSSFVVDGGNDTSIPWGSHSGSDVANVPFRVDSVPGGSAGVLVSSGSWINGSE